MLFWTSYYVQNGTKSIVCQRAKATTIGFKNIRAAHVICVRDIVNNESNDYRVGNCWT